MLKEIFPNDYDEYCKKTGRFVPKLRLKIMYCIQISGLKNTENMNFLLNEIITFKIVKN
jgi:hypothetical protein